MLDTSCQYWFMVHQLHIWTLVVGEKRRKSINPTQHVFMGIENHRKQILKSRLPPVSSWIELYNALYLNNLFTITRLFNRKEFVVPPTRLYNALYLNNLFTITRLFNRKQFVVPPTRHREVMKISCYRSNHFYNILSRQAEKLYKNIGKNFLLKIYRKFSDKSHIEGEPALGEFYVCVELANPTKWCDYD